MALSNAQGFIGAGDVYIALIDAAGVAGALIDIGNTTKLGIKPASTIKEQKSKKRDSYGQVLETVALQDTAELSATLETVNRVGLRYAFMGEDATYTQSAGAVTDEATIAKLDGWVALAAEEITGFVLTNVGATVTYVLGTDYLVNTRLGMYKALVGVRSRRTSRCSPTTPARPSPVRRSAATSSRRSARICCSTASTRSTTASAS